VTVVAVQGVKERGNLSMLPELGLKTALPYVENVEEFGHRVHVALLQVSSILTSCLKIFVLTAENRHEGNSTPCLRSPVVDEERMRPVGHF